MGLMSRLQATLRNRTFRRFARNACESRQVISIKLREAYPLVGALEQLLITTRSLEQPKAFAAATEGLSLSCPKCGEYNDDARSLVLLGGQGGAFEQMAGVTFGGPKAAALGQGGCPGCGGDTVAATFDPQRANIYDAGILEDAGGCFLRSTVLAVMRSDWERLSEGQRFDAQLNEAAKLLVTKHPMSQEAARAYVYRHISMQGKSSTS